MAVHFIVTRDSIADICDNCNFLAFLEEVFSTKNSHQTKVTVQAFVEPAEVGAVAVQVVAGV